jgi:hypothetical protein
LRGKKKKKKNENKEEKNKAEPLYDALFKPDAPSLSKWPGGGGEFKVHR